MQIDFQQMQHKSYRHLFYILHYLYTNIEEKNRLRLRWEDKRIWISNSNLKMCRFEVFNISFFDETYKGCKKRLSYTDLHHTWNTLTLLHFQNFWAVLPKISICCVVLLCYTQSIICMQVVYVLWSLFMFCGHA